MDVSGLIQQGHTVIDGLDNSVPHEDFDSLQAHEGGGSSADREST